MVLTMLQCENKPTCVRCWKAPVVVCAPWRFCERHWQEFLYEQRKAEFMRKRVA